MVRGQRLFIKPGLDPDFTKEVGTPVWDGSKLRGSGINLDQEEIGILNNGCSGGLRFTYTGGFERTLQTGNDVGIEILLEGLRGGHSGEDIGKGRLSAATVLGSLLFSVAGYDMIDDDFLTDERASGVVYELLKAIPTGAFEFSEEDARHVTKSNNVGVVTLDEGYMKFLVFTRSDYNDWIAGKKEHYINLAADYSLNYDIESEYPAWLPKQNNLLENLTLKNYRQVVPNAYATPCMGGLEPAIFVQKVPGMEMTSIGPELTDVHTINETLHTETVKPVLQTLIQVLLNADTLP